MARPAEYQQALTQRRSRADFFASWEADFPLFSEESLWIQGKENKNYLCKFTPAQEEIHNTVQRDKALTQYIRALTLKARQVGSTTYWLLLAAWLCLLFPGSRVVIVSQAELTSKDLIKKVKFALNRLPRWMRRMQRFAWRGGAFEVNFANGSQIRAGTANSEYWRSSTMDFALLTEATSYDDLAATMRAILPACYGPAVIESTAKGLGLFKDMWEDTNAAWTKIFISWLMDPTCELEETRQQPTAEDREYIATHKLTRRQANWYLETKWTTYAGNQRDFDQEHPATPELAFAVAGDRYFRGRLFQYDPRDMPKDEIVWWEKPRANRKYALGGDVGMGHLDGDASTGVLLDITDPMDVRIVATLQCWHQTPLYAERLIEIGKKVEAAGGRVLVIIETNVGLDVVREVKKARLRQFTRIEYKKKFEDWPDEYGFYTTKQSRSILMTSLTRYVLGNRIADLRDPRLMAECNSFVYNDKGKPVAASGKHDDLVLALALALQGVDEIHQLEAPNPPQPIPPRPIAPHEAVQWDMKYAHLRR